jgi:hypothetical protein
MSEPTHSHPHAHGDQLAHQHIRTSQRPARSVLAWPTWLRVAAVMPIVIALWLAVLWANEGFGLW